MTTTTTPAPTTTLPVPIPATLETPPRTTGNIQQDLPILINWFWRAYQVITQSVAYINSQVSNPEFNVANLPDPSNTTLAAAQTTANNAYNLANTASKRLDGQITGTFPISDTNVGATITFTTPQLDSNYRIEVQAVSSSGTPIIDSFVVAQKTYTATSFTVTMFGAPGAGNTVNYEWQLIRNT